MAPSYATIRRAAMTVDADEFDLIINTCAAAGGPAIEDPGAT
jgi:hypothetical protein